MPCAVRVKTRLRISQAFVANCLAQCIIERCDGTCLGRENAQLTKNDELWHWLAVLTISERDLCLPLDPCHQATWFRFLTCARISRECRQTSRCPCFPVEHQTQEFQHSSYCINRSIRSIMWYVEIIAIAERVVRNINLHWTKLSVIQQM